MVTLSVQRLTVIVVAVAYLFIATRYPQWTQDDPGWFGVLFPAFDLMPSGQRFYELMFVHNSGTNEFRTYGLSKLFHYGLAHSIGPKAWAFWLISALINVATAAFVGITVSKALRDSIIGVAAFALWLIGPFSLWQTFHHASYILLPMMFVAAYAALLVAPQRAISAEKAFVGAILVLLACNTGEAAIGVLVTVQAILAFSEYRSGPRINAIIHVTLAGVTLLTVGALYAFYRLAVYKPELPLRLPSIEWSNMPWMIVGFVANILDRFVSKSMSAFIDVRIVALSLALAVVLACMPFGRMRAASLAHLGAALLIFASATPFYLALGSASGFVTPEYRHQQIPGLLLGVTFVIAASMAGRFKQVCMAVLIGGNAFSFTTNFAIKVPTNYYTNTDIGRRISLVRSTSRAVLILRNPKTPLGMSLTEPYAFDPSSNPLQASWSAESYAKLDWDFQIIGSRYYRRSEDGKIVVEGQFGSVVVEAGDIVVVFRGSGIEIFPTLDAFESANGRHEERLN